MYKALSRPFRNLSVFDTLALWIRLTSTVLAITFGLILILGPLSMPNRMCLAMFNTRSSDITQGLFEELKTAVEVFGSTNVNSGVGLTTSEIMILTEYTAKKTQDLPQFISFTLYGTCSVKLISNEVAQSTNSTQTAPNAKNSTEQYCQTSGPGYVFNYREILAQLSLNIVLDYAYEQELNSAIGLASDYSTYMSSLHGRKASSVELLCVTIMFQVVIFGLTLWYYNIKGRSINPLKERILTHTLSLLSAVSFICGLIGVINLTWITYSLRKRINNELNLLGFSLTIGQPWFVCLWFFTFFTLLLTIIWSGLEWCVTNVSGPYNDETRDNILGYEAGVLTTCDDQISNFTGLLPRNIKHSDNTAMSRTSSRSIDHMEVHEMQDISHISTHDSNLSYQGPVKPSSTMYF